ncbi:MAG: hypothetical protein ACYS9X_00725 [Planctomycetota bacterium]|jgi:hypothetical protein
MERSPSQKARDRRDGERPVWVTGVTFAAVLLAHMQVGVSWGRTCRYLAQMREDARERYPRYHSGQAAGKPVSVLEPDWYAPWRFTNEALRLAVGISMFVSVVFLWKLRFYAIWMVFGAAAASAVLAVTDLAGNRIALGTAACSSFDEEVFAFLYLLVIVFVLTGDRKAFYIAAERAVPEDAPPGDRPPSPPT